MDLNQNLFDLVVQFGALLQDRNEEGYQNVRDNRRQSGSSSSTQKITSIEQLFSTEEKATSYLKDGKYEEAYQLTKGQYKRRSNILFAPVLVRYFVTLMRTNRSEKATKVRDELTTLLLDNLEVPPKEIERYGRNRKSTGDVLETFLFYQIAERFCQNERSATDVINVLHRCCGGTASIVSKLLDQRQVNKQLVKSYVLPFMRKILSHIGKFLSNDRKQVSFVQGVCLHYIEQCEYSLGDLNARESTLNEAITLFRKELGNDAEKRHVFGGCLNNLGHTHLLKNRPNEAAKLFSEAIEAKEKAEDYDTAQERKEDIEKSRKALAIARKQS